MFWIVFVIMVTYTAIIFMNFVIAEASNVYNEVNERLQANIYMTKAKLISEADRIRPFRFKTTKSYPKYIITRNIDS